MCSNPHEETNTPVTSLESSRFAIKSLNVVLEDHSEPIEAIILIQDGKIAEVVIPKETDPQLLSDILSNWEIRDYGNLFIFPGLIDSNVHLHADFDKQWENIAYCTELAASGGVTMIVDNPVMSNSFETSDEYIEGLKRKIQTIQSKSKVDFGILGILDPKTKENVGEILQAGVLGLKAYFLNCFQSTIGHFPPEEVETLVKDLSTKYPELLLVLHPEVATERELFLTSPCRAVDLEKRTDLTYDIKSIERGGAANKGSYLDDLCRKQDANDAEVEGDENSPTSLSPRSPSKLRAKIEKLKEKTEVDDIVQFELLSYSFDSKQNEINNEQAMAEFEPEFLEKLVADETQSPDHKGNNNGIDENKLALLLKKLEPISNEEAKEKDGDAQTLESEGPELTRSDSSRGGAGSPIKKSQFARSNRRMSRTSIIKREEMERILAAKPIVLNNSNDAWKKALDSVPETEDKVDILQNVEVDKSDKETQEKEIEEQKQERSIIIKKLSTHILPQNNEQPETQADETPQSREQRQERSIKIKKLSTHILPQNSELPEPQADETPQSRENIVSFVVPHNKSENTTTQTGSGRGFYFRRQSGRMSINTDTNESEPNVPRILQDKPEQEQEKSQSETSSIFPEKVLPQEEVSEQVNVEPTSLEGPLVEPRNLLQSRRLKVMSLALDEPREKLSGSPITPEGSLSVNNERKSLQNMSMSPTIRTKTPMSSLLQRRISRNTSCASSTVTSPRGGQKSMFSRTDSLEITKLEQPSMQKEAKFNQSYPTFLANRPQSWEENAVTMILSTLKHDTNLRIIFSNLSLASSLLKIRRKKKLDEVFFGKLFGDVSPSHLFFNDKSVRTGETKYKVSPPFRNMENQQLLIENFKLGGIDMLSSYHFFVPQEYKDIDDGNFRRAMGGLNSMGISLQAAWTSLYCYQQTHNKRFLNEPLYKKKVTNIIIRQMYKSLCANPAQALGISHRKGQITKGKDADFVIWDPFKVDKNFRLSNNHVFIGKPVLGTVIKTYLRGNTIFDSENCGVKNVDFTVEFIKP